MSERRSNEGALEMSNGPVLRVEEEMEGERVKSIFAGTDEVVGLGGVS